MAEISVIIPVYNTDKYLSECLESVIASSLFNVCEVIIIDDGSSDNSVAVAESYCKKYKNISLYSYSNGGLSAARNRGLSLASGKYIFFLDSDDYIASDYIEKLYESIREKDCDIVFAGFSRSDLESGICYKVERKALETNQVISGCEYLEKRMDVDDWQNQVWCAIYRKDFFDKYKLKFSENVRVYEDILFTNRILLYAESVYMIPEYGYMYRVREGSLVQGGVTDFDISNCILIMNEFCKEYPTLNRVQRHGIGRVYFQLISMILYCIGDIKSEHKAEFFNNLSALRLWKPLVRSVSNIKELIKLIVFRTNWGLYYNIVKSNEVNYEYEPETEVAEPLVSVIIPCFNSAETLERCLKSVTEQEYQNIEVIAVDDGSTDNTLEILNEFAKEHSSFKIINCEHGGVSAARNEALKAVSGDYIQFVDSDDYLVSGCTRLMVNAALNTDADLVFCDYYQYSDYDNNVYHRHLPAGIHNKKNFLKELAKDPGAHYYGVIWNKFYKAKIIKDNGLMFDSSLSMGEDFIFNTNYFHLSKMFCSVNRQLYVYKWGRADSLSNVSKSEEQRICERLKMYRAYEKMYNKENLKGYWRFLMHFYIMRYYFDELTFLGENAVQWQKTLFKRCIMENGISNIEFKTYELLRKAKQLLRKIRG